MIRSHTHYTAQWASDNDADPRSAPGEEQRASALTTHTGKPLLQKKLQLIRSIAKITIIMLIKFPNQYIIGDVEGHL